MKLRTVQFFRHVSLLILFNTLVLITGISQDDLFKQVDEVFLSMNTTTTPGCACSTMQNGELLYEKGYGMANLEYGIVIRPNSVFHVASVSKHFTAMAIELLVNRGQVSWDDDIRMHVPEVPDFGTRITLRHLVHHVSGIRDQWNLLARAGWRWEADVVTQKDVLEITSRQKALNFHPGERYLYSNTGFTLLAVVVERITGKTLREFCEEEMFGPLGMNDTHFHDDHEMIVPNRAFAYENDSDGLFGLKQSIPDFDVVGATSLFTTVSDLARWDRNFYTGQVGGKEGIGRLHETFTLNNGETIDYRHGISAGDYRGLPTMGHGGADAGYRSHFLRFPEQDFAVAVLCNFPSSNPGSLARKVADIFLVEKFTEESPDDKPMADSEITVSRDLMERLCGTYHAKKGDRIYKLEMVNDVFTFATGPGYALKPLEKDIYLIEGTESRIRIKPAVNGERASLEFLPNNSGDVYYKLDDWDEDAIDLNDYMGNFYSVELGTEYRFSVEDDSLIFHHRKLVDSELTPLFEDAFRLDVSTVVFERDSAGDITGFRQSDGRVWNVKFVKSQ